MWLATHCQVPFSFTQVSANRPRRRYGLVSPARNERCHYSITMGLLELAGLAIYLRLSDILRGGLRCLLFIFGFLVVLGVHYYVLHLQFSGTPGKTSCS